MKPDHCRAKPSKQRIPRQHQTLSSCVTISFAFTAMNGTLQAGDTVPTSERISPIAGDYGFQSMVLSKLGESVSNLTPADIDGDGRGDLAVVQNSRAKIELLMVPKTGELPGDGKPATGKLNELNDETFFRRESLPVEEKVTALAIADVTGDAVPEILYLGDSGRLTLAQRRGASDYITLQRLDLEEPSPSSTAIRVAEIVPGRRSLIVLGVNSTQLFGIGADGKYALELSLPNASRGADQLHVTDLDGDGRLDLVYVVFDSEWPIRYRLAAQPDGSKLRFGPEVTCRFAAIRSVQFRDVDGQPGAEAICVRAKSGRLAMLRFVAQGQGSEGPLSSLRSIPFRPLKDADQREFVVLEGSQGVSPAVLVVEPNAAQVSGFHDLLASGGVPGIAASFSQVSRPRLADIDGDGVNELVVASVAERVVGISQFSGTSITFPRALPIPEGGDLLALDACDLDGDGKAEISLVVGEGKGKDRKGRILALDSEGKVKDSFDLGKLSKDPTDVWRIDLDRDGRRDALLFVARDLPRILLARADGKGFDELKVEERGLGLLNGLERSQLAFGDVDRDGHSELLVPKGNFVRAIYLDASRLPATVLQCNLDDPAAQVKRVALFDLDQDGVREIVAHNETGGRLEVWRADGKTSERLAKVDLGGVVPTYLAATDLDLDGKQDILVGAADRLGVVKNGAGDPGFASVTDLEIPLKNAFPDRLALGDVNGDGGIDAVLSETVDHQMLFVAIHPAALEYALRFRVFETRIFESQRGGREPREVVVADCSGDGKLDVAIVVHDRVIVYPQE